MVARGAYLLHGAIAETPPMGAAAPYGADGSAWGPTRACESDSYKAIFYQVFKHPRKFNTNKLESWIFRTFDSEIPLFISTPRKIH